MRRLRQRLVLISCWGWLLLVSCSTAEYTSHNIRGKAYGTTVMEASLAQYNFSVAEINLAVANGRLSVDQAIPMLEYLAAMTERERSIKRVSGHGVHIDEIIRKK